MAAREGSKERGNVCGVPVGALRSGGAQTGQRVNAGLDAVERLARLPRAEA